MKGIKNAFLNECKTAGCKIIIGDRWHCNQTAKTITVPVQNSTENIFYGFHELAHFILHRDDKRNYDDLLSRIEIEREADQLAGSMMLKHGFDTCTNNYTLALIALYVSQGNKFLDFETETEDGFTTLKRWGVELFSQFTNNLPFHPAIY